jgi:predicted MFS family arabinose efflux permease
MRNPTLRALGLSVTTSNLGWGMFFLALPVLVLQGFGGGAEFVGLLFALNGVAGSIAVLVMGRVSTLGSERKWLALAMLGEATSFAIVLAWPQPLVVALAMVALGIATGPFDIVLFTLRQRRTDPAWLGRAFAVSMAINFVGFPIGSAVAGAVVPVSIGLVLVAAVACELLAALFAFVAVPTEDALA